MVHVALDGTPLLGQRTGIGRYTEHLLAALAERADLTVSATAFTLRGAGRLGALVPPGVATRSFPMSARVLRSVWTRAEFPSVALFSGRCDVFHGTNFVLPPTGRAGGVVTIHDLAYLTMPDVVDDTSLRLRDRYPAACGGQLQCAPPAKRLRTPCSIPMVGPCPRWWSHRWGSTLNGSRSRRRVSGIGVGSVCRLITSSSSEPGNRGRTCRLCWPRTGSFEGNFGRPVPFRRHCCWWGRRAGGQGTNRPRASRRTAMHPSPSFAALLPGPEHSSCHHATKASGSLRWRVWPPE